MPSLARWSGWSARSCPSSRRPISGLASQTVTLSFLVSFGIVKALSNLFAGRLSDRVGRKRILVAGWLAGLGVPVLLILAPSWGWIVFANVLLGINQGLCWSTTVIMKIDLVGPKRRGLAMGLNESAGYLAVSFSALLTGYLAASYGLRPVPFCLDWFLPGWGCCFCLLHTGNPALCASGSGDSVDWRTIRPICPQRQPSARSFAGRVGRTAPCSLPARRDWSTT